MHFAMKRNFKIVSLLTIFTIVLNVFSVLVLLKPVAAMTNMKDTMSRLQSSADAPVLSSHAFSLGLTATPVEGDTVVISLPGDFDCTGLVTGDVSNLAANWSITTADAGTCTITLTAGVGPAQPVTATIADTHMVNPDTPGQYDVTYDFADGTETGLGSVYIVDSDQVMVNGYINTSIMFDLDVGTSMGDWPNESVLPSVTPTTAPTISSQMLTECAYDACQLFAGGGTGGNYTVDLGNLTIGAVNASGVSVTHSTGDGMINYIGFDLSTNAYNGFTVTYVSQNGALHGDHYNIPSVGDDGTPINAGTSAYGLSMPTDPSYVNYAGTSTPTNACGSDYCTMTTDVHTLFSGDGAIESARGTVMIGAAIDGTVPAGTYTDTLTFIATGTF
jgi:hypothetical protein